MFKKAFAELDRVVSASGAGFSRLSAGQSPLQVSNTSHLLLTQKSSRNCRELITSYARIDQDSVLVQGQSGETPLHSATPTGSAVYNPFADDGAKPVDQRSSDDIIQEMPQDYFSAAFDPVQYELLQLPVHVDQHIIEELVESRTHALEVRLSWAVVTRTEHLPV
jgi:hypothetical protein